MAHTTLTPFEGRDVVGTAIAVTNAGDGLSHALKVDPVEYEHGETVFVLLETVVAKVRFEPSKDNPEALIRVTTLKAGIATEIDHATANKLLAAQRKRLEEAEGISKLPGMDEDEVGDE